MIILAITALIGTQLLHLFGVSLDAFIVAGGGVLAWMEFSAERSRHFTTLWRCRSGFGCVPIATHSLRGEPWDPHWRYHALGRTHRAGSSGYSS